MVGILLRLQKIITVCILILKMPVVTVTWTDTFRKLHIKYIRCYVCLIIKVTGSSEYCYKINKIKPLEGKEAVKGPHHKLA